ncbi:hypothetical protein COO60DRAFT_1701120 [Scenedesmus sp. NREL 46B-D3]|nr:hypothetical protein COO60DRAFT_1701120 [Scenedesmus sp. NREL 46B-D3]
MQQTEQFEEAQSTERQQQQQTSSSSSEQAAANEASSSGTSSGSAESSSSAGDSSSGSSSSAGFGGFQQQFNSFKSRLGGSSSSSSSEQQEQVPLGQRAHQLWDTVRREVADAVLPRQERYSLTRAYDGPTYQAPDTPYEGPTALAAVKAPESKMDKVLADLYERFGHHPLFAKLRRVDIKDTPIFKKGAELADDIRDKYETSDHPAVHKVEDVKEKLFGMSETAAAMAIIRSRDPRFDMTTLLDGVRFDAPRVVKAFLTHDLPTLRKHCGPELMERLEGIFKHFEAQGLFEDPTILFTGEPELVELKMVDEEPLVVVQFACQQLKCTRDKFGNVMDGSPNSIQKVFYFWGLQQESRPVVLPDARVLPPRFVIKDMMWQSMLALV